MYADSNYYDHEYKGTEVEDGEELQRMLNRASDHIDHLINYKLNGVDVEQLHPFIVKQLKKATCAQVDAWEREGGLDSVGQQFSSVNVGKFSYSQNDTLQTNKPDETVLNYLKPTGLLHRGVNIRAY